MSKALVIAGGENRSPIAMTCANHPNSSLTGHSSDLQTLTEPCLAFQNPVGRSIHVNSLHRFSRIAARSRSAPRCSHPAGDSMVFLDRSWVGRWVVGDQRTGDCTRKNSGSGGSFSLEFRVPSRLFQFPCFGSVCIS